jgi:hypothetical protein
MLSEYGIISDLFENIEMKKPKNIELINKMMIRFLIQIVFINRGNKE